MGKSTDLSSDMKAIIIRNYEAGKSYSEIGRNFQLNRATVYAVVKRYRVRGDIVNRPRSGRKKNLDDRDTRKLLRLAKNNRLLPLQDITRKFNENRENVISSVTVRRCLYRNNFHRRVVQNKY
jgi:transposase